MRRDRPPGLSAWQQILAFQATVLYRIDEELRNADCISLAWFDVLIELRYAPNAKLRQNELAAACKLTKSGVSRILSTLEKAGLVSRRADPSDKRGSFAVLNKKGRDALRKAWPIYRGCLEQYFALPENDYSKLERIFGRLNEGL